MEKYKAFYLHVKELLTLRNQKIKDASLLASLLANLITTNKHIPLALLSTINQLQPAPAAIFATSTEDCEMYSSFFCQQNQENDIQHCAPVIVI